LRGDGIRSNEFARYVFRTNEKKHPKAKRQFSKIIQPASAAGNALVGMRDSMYFMINFSRADTLFLRQQIPLSIVCPKIRREGENLALRFALTFQ